MSEVEVSVLMTRSAEAHSPATASFTCRAAMLTWPALPDAEAGRRPHLPLTKALQVAEQHPVTAIQERHRSLDQLADDLLDSEATMRAYLAL
jgi:hypothetical protein